LSVYKDLSDGRELQAQTTVPREDVLKGRNYACDPITGACGRRDKRRCGFVRPDQGVNNPAYLVDSVAETPAGRVPKGPPTAADVLKHCLCQLAGTAQRASLGCPKTESEQRMECLRNPWGPDDAPRPECVSSLVEDTKEYSYRFKGCEYLYCTGDDVLTVRTPSSSGAGVSCGCLPVRVLTGILRMERSCSLIDCGPDSYCDGGMCKPRAGFKTPLVCSPRRPGGGALAAGSPFCDEVQHRRP
jgi:hypothetical protein